VGDLIFKLAGAACVIGAAAAWGERKARSLAQRVEHLRQLRRSLALLAAEISYARSVLPYAFQAVAKRSAYPARELFLAASEMLLAGGEAGARQIWKQAAERVLPGSCCSAADREIIAGLGASLGVSQQEGQLNQIRLTMQHLDSALEEAQDQRERGEKMWRYLGFAGGAAVVILLL
jgi:stage III sporulation protein AB